MIFVMRQPELFTVAGICFMDKEPPIKKGNATDHLANERTFLAWVRTAIAVMAFGFVVVKFSLFVKQLGLMFTDKTVRMPNSAYSGISGLLMVILGALITVFAYMRYKKVEKQLNEQAFHSSTWLVAALTVIILLVSIFMVIYLIP